MFKEHFSSFPSLIPACPRPAEIHSHRTLARVPQRASRRAVCCTYSDNFQTFLNAGVLPKAGEIKIQLDVNKQPFCCRQWWCIELSFPLCRARVQAGGLSWRSEHTRAPPLRRHATCEHVYVTRVPEKHPKAVTPETSHTSFQRWSHQNAVTRF